MGVMPLLVKNCWTLSTAWAGALVNHPSWHGQMHWKSVQKNFTGTAHSLSQQCQLRHWYTWGPRTLTYSPRAGSLYYKGSHPPEDNSGLGGGPPSYICSTQGLNVMNIHTHIPSTIINYFVLKTMSKRKRWAVSLRISQYFERLTTIMAISWSICLVDGHGGQNFKKAS